MKYLENRALSCKTSLQTGMHTLGTAHQRETLKVSTRRGRCIMENSVAHSASSRDWGCLLGGMDRHCVFISALLANIMCLLGSGKTKRTKDRSNKH